MPRSSRNLRRGVREVGHVEAAGRLAAAAEPGEVGHERVEVVGEALGRRQEVPARQAEAVHVHHHRRVGRILRLAVEHVDAVDRRPPLGECRRRRRRRRVVRRPEPVEDVELVVTIDSPP